MTDWVNDLISQLIDVLDINEKYVHGLLIILNFSQLFYNLFYNFFNLSMKSKKWK